MESISNVKYYSLKAWWQGKGGMAKEEDIHSKIILPLINQYLTSSNFGFLVSAQPPVSDTIYLATTEPRIVEVLRTKYELIEVEYVTKEYLYSSGNWGVFGNPSFFVPRK